MNKINCLITTNQHREIAKKLGLDPTIVTNLASVYQSRYPYSSGATERDIKALLQERDTAKEEAYLAIPIYTDMQETVKKNEAIASTSSTGEIKLRRLPKEGGMDYFFDYVSGKIEGNKTSQQKKAVFDKLIENKIISDVEELKSLLQTPFEVYQFLLWHEMSHAQNNDVKHYWDNGEDLLTPDKIEIEYRATIDALNKVKEYNKKYQYKRQKTSEKTETEDTNQGVQQVAKITDETINSNVDNMPPIGLDRIKVDKENIIFKIASTFTPQQRRDRVDLLSRLFSDNVTGILEELILSKQEELEVAKKNEDIELQLKINRTLELLNDPVKGRHEVIKYATVEKIIEDIRNSIEEMVEYADNDYQKRQYQNMLDNFDYLLDLASFKIERNENLRLSITKGIKHTKDSSKEIIKGNIEEIPEDIEDNEREQDDDDEDGNRATGNDGWSYKIRLIDPHKTISSTTKKILSNIVKLNNVTGDPEVDDLGNERYLDEQFAHTVLLNHLSNMIDDSDFCIKETDEEGNISYSLPALEKLVSKYKWVQQIIDELTNNPTEVSAFYADFRKDFIPYWKTREVVEDGKTVVQSVPLNQATGFESTKNRLIDNYEQGSAIDKDSIYNSSGQIAADKVTVGEKILSSIDLQEVEEEEYDEISNKLAKLLRMTGFPASSQDIKNIWDDAEGIENITDIYNKLSFIYNSAKKGINKKNYHLIAENETEFNRLSHLLGEVTELDNVGSFRNGDKTYYSYSAPNYLNTQIKELKSNNRREKYLSTEFKEYDWFYDKNKNKWKGSTNDKSCWLEQIERDEEVRNNIVIRELLAIDGSTYSEWTPGQIYERFITEYFSAGYNPGSKKQYAYYNYPIFSDSPVAMLIKMPRYTENVEEEIIPRLRQVVLQELSRIKLVEDRNKEDVSPIACFDGKRGREFCFFPFLNKWVSEDGKSFRTKVAELKSQGIESVSEFIDSVLSEYMVNEFNKFILNSEDVKKNLVKKGIAENSDDAYNKLKEYFYNHHYAETQIIQLTVTDLAFYKDGNDFQKRYKEVYASGTRLNTQSKYGRTFERTIYLKDQEITSTSYTDIKSALSRAKERWIAKGMNPKVAQMSVDSILHEFRNINATDAQAYRSLSSFRAILDMLGAWDNNMQRSFERIQSGNWGISDFNVVYQTIKPFVYTQIGKDSGVNGTKIKVPHQNKNSEFLLLAMHQMIASSTGLSPQLVAINKFMESNNIDVVQFETAVKSGNQGSIDITYSESSLQSWINNNRNQWKEFKKNSKLEENASDFDVFKEGNDVLLDKGAISQKEYNNRFKQILPTEEEVTKILNRFAFNEDGTTNNNVIHTIPYKDYMVAQPSKEHLFDKEQMSESVFGSQYRNLIVSDISEEAKFIVNGKEYNKGELIHLFNSLIVENLLEDFNKVSKRFNSIEELQKALLSIVKGNDKYGKNLLDALQLVDYTNPDTGVTKKVFNIPLYSPSITTQVQEVLNSMFKNSVTKQKIKGSACTLVSNFGFTQELNLKFNREGDITSGLKYVECYLPWYSKKYFEPLLKEVTKDGVTYQEIDINEIPSELLEMVGYRIPTEDKYSMVPLRVKGFLPQQNGSVIMLPADITKISGSDFDIDKLYIMMPEYGISNYDRKSALRDFKEINSDTAVNKLIANLLNSEESLDTISDEDFKDWWKKNKEKYRMDKPYIYKIRYNSNKAPNEQSKAARNNMLIDLGLSILRNEDTVDKFLNPGSFDKIKLAERVSNILSNSEYLKAYANSKGINIDILFTEDFTIEQYDSVESFEMARRDLDSKRKEVVKKVIEAIKKETLSSLNEFLKNYRQERDPLSLDTFAYYHQQNMSGAVLIGMYANNTTMQAKFQNTGIRLKIIPEDKKTGFKGIDNTFTIDGNTIEKLDSIYSPWGERISKNCAEFSAASVDNVKDPVLAGIMQNTNTAKIAGFMLRAGIPINIIGLLFTQPIIRDCILDTGGLKYKDLKKRIKDPYKGHISITTDELMSTIILNDYSSSTANKIATLMLHIQKCASDMSSITNISRADSPNGAIKNTLGAARNQSQRVTNLEKKAELPSFTIAGINKSIMKNDRIFSTNSIETMRERIMSSKMPRLQAFYSLGIELPLQLMSPHLIQLSTILDGELNKIYSQAPRGILEDNKVEAFYKDFIEYMLTDSNLFGNDNERTFNEKRDYYLYKFPSKFYASKQNPKFSNYNILNKMSVVAGDIVLKRSGKFTKYIMESLTSDFDSMITSEDPEVIQMSVDLFMYSFYKEGYAFGPNSFGYFFSPFFLHSFPEFMETLRSIEQKINTVNMDRFVSQFYNNYWKDITVKIDNDMDPLHPIVKVDTNNENSDILVPKKNCINEMSGIARNPYIYIQFENKLYHLKTSTSTVCTYYRVATFTDTQGKKYNINESIQDMIDNATDINLINENKKIGAKMVTFEDMDKIFDSLDSFEGLEDLDRMFEDLENMDTTYNMEDSIAQLDEPLCL